VEIIEERCIGCGKCSELCPVDALIMEGEDDKNREDANRPRLDEKMCLGCGVCVNNCPTEALRLKSRPNRVITPVDTAHRTVIMAIERGTLQNLIFDNQTMLSHRALAAFFGAILRLDPVKRVLANTQLKSRYLEALLERFN
jgi:NAD-dependent dihydropyrimidine dehydrogenase PreA subunit